MQVAHVFNYRFRYAGPTPAEGCCAFDILKGFKTNPCLDAQGDDGDPSIQVSQPVVITPVTRPVQGFQIQVTDVDNPTSIAPLIAKNTIADQMNYLFEAWRDEAFLTCLAARSPDGKLSILGAIRWKVVWHAGFRWKQGVDTPRLKALDIQTSGFIRDYGAPKTADPWSRWLSRPPARPPT